MTNQAMPARKSNSGSVTVELPLAAPLLLLLFVGAADLGRVFYHAVTLANAAGTGAFYGAQSNVASGHFQDMEQVAKNDAQDLGTAITATGARFCDCPNGTKVDCVTGSCPGYGKPRVYVSVQTAESFSPFMKYPSVPNPVQVGRKAYMRVQ